MGEDGFDVLESLRLQQRSNSTKILSESSNQAAEISGSINQFHRSICNRRFGAKCCWGGKGKRSHDEKRNEAEKTHVGDLSCLRGCSVIDRLDWTSVELIMKLHLPMDTHILLITSSDN